MKTSLFKKATISLAIVASLSACTKQRIYYLEEENKHGQWNVLATLDDYNEKFFFRFETKGGVSSEQFEFMFSFRYEGKNGVEFITNKNDMVMQFVYRLSDGTEIEFNESGFYCFAEDTKINVWYNYADKDIKEAIKAREFSIDFGVGEYHPQKMAE